ncbi:c-type cytochrome [Piscinibacter koreensis]|uniref:C-type cytochrome n=1 Tax=Piscinibacter koreensis TaxID=2742824 RepID=A0A7Y6NPK4_9BURK|nr:c-type cytochrome [Schlegelella koreensis]NUZ07017.1 c-type cytochrome [Schlegelella koreensis]
MKTLLIVLAAGAALGFGTAAAVVYGGLYDISATTAHTQSVYSLLETTMRRSVQLRARDIAVPDLTAPAVVARGAACFREHCVQCHGAPGVAPGAVGKSMQPLPGSLIDAARHWRPAEVYWITRNGIKMSGMPAWALRLADDDIWATVAFVERLPLLSPSAYAAAVAEPARCEESEGSATASTPSTPTSRDDAARIALQQYACTACHVVPGIAGSNLQVGPPLAGLARRSLLAGGLPNTSENLVRWIRDPRGIDPRTAMPNLGVGEAHARLMADYLLGLR